MDRHKELHEENELLRRRLDAVLGAFNGCKWADAGPLWRWQPEDEKYVTRESMLAAIDKEIANDRGQTCGPADPEQKDGR